MAAPSTTWSDPLAGSTFDESIDAAVARLTRRERRAQIRLGHVFARADRLRHYRRQGCATLGEFGERFGQCDEEARQLAFLGHALAIVDGLEERFLAGRLSLKAVRSLWFAVKPDGREADSRCLVSERRPIAKWLNLACATGTREFTRLVRHLRVARRLGVAPSRLELLVAPETLDKFQRAKVVARHLEKRVLTEDEVLDLLLDTFLDKNDLLGKKNGKPRLADCRDPKGRYVPMAVRRVVWDRDGGRCVHPGCNWDGELHFGHIHAHADGGGNLEDNICLECPLHNQMVRVGLIRILGPAWNPGFQYKVCGDRWSETGSNRILDVEEHRRRYEVARRKYLGVPERDRPNMAARPHARDGELSDGELSDGNSAEDEQFVEVDRLWRGWLQRGIPAPEWVIARCEERGWSKDVIEDARRALAKKETAARERLRCAAGDDGWRTDSRVRVPHLESDDSSRLEGWLDDFFAT